MATQDSAIDVVIVTSPYPRGDDKPMRELDYFNSCLRISEDIWLGDIDSDLTKGILDACESRYENFSPVRQYGGAYGLIRFRAPAPDTLQFDPDQVLSATVALSRLVHPTSIGLSYAARVRYLRDGDRQIIPGAPPNMNPNAFVSQELSNWLIPADAGSLADLVAAYQRQDAPQRVRSALWNHESAFRNYFIENRWAIIVTGLEALFHVRDELVPKTGRRAGSTRPFAQRASQAASLLGIGGATESHLRRSYATRSEIVHGAGVHDADPDVRALYIMTESLLSACIRAALLDSTFASRFASDEAVRDAFPLY